MKNKFFCVGNAHLDPAWMWCWQEGSAEAKATLRSALDRMKEFPDFKFVCAGASVYEWIEEFDPKMFAEIQERVREGRFVIVGGWYVQPDCNIPSGEGFARQSLYSQRYFYEKFGVTATTGYNVDSFGHNGNIPMILRHSGMQNYIFMRPQEKEKSLDSNVFYWQSQDGSQVLAYRIGECYCNKFDTTEALEKKLKEASETAPRSLEAGTLFYGVGNHGGGPTIRHIELLQEWEKNHAGSIVFSDLKDLFDFIREQKKFSVPTYQDDMQHHASGCYAAYAPIKKAIRQGETSLSEAEFFSMLATSLLAKKYPAEEYKKGWKDICFIHFHDICGGCCIKDAYIDAENFASEAKAIATKQVNNAAQSLSWAIDTSDKSKGTPVVFLNPHPFPVEDLCKINLRITSAHDENDNELPVQHIVSQTVLCGRRTDSLIRVKIPALGYVTYYINRNDAPHGIKYMAPEVRETVDSVKHVLPTYKEVKYTFHSIEDDYFRIRFDLQTGYLTEIFDKKKNRQLLASVPKRGIVKKGLFRKRYQDTSFVDVCGGVPIVIDESEHDTWSHRLNYFDKEIGYFNQAKIHFVERGPLRVGVKIVSFYGKSTLEQIFSLANDGMVRCHVKVDWHEKQKMLKLSYPCNLTETRSLYEIPFGAIERPTNGEEECGQMWCAVCGKEGGIAMLNDGKYSFSMTDNRMCITAVRSPYFGDHGYARYATEDTDVTDQGVTEFEYAVLPFTDCAEITKRARLFNKKPTVIIENNHTGTLPDKTEGIHVSCDNILVSALKRSEDGKGIILRAYETNGKATKVRISGEVLPYPLETEYSPYSVQTYYLEDGSEIWKKVLFTEYEE